MRKDELLKAFQRDWKKYWELDFLKEINFKRYICKNCGKAYWAIQEQKTCNDSSCTPYTFIDNPVGKKMSYLKVWKAIRNFFVNEGHKELKRYPTVCRWYPLYFTIAGIVNFYRMENSSLAFEFPANPIIMNQPCLRFNDIPNVGISGRHFTCFGMIQQSSLYDGKVGYWKDRCIELNYRLLTEVFKIRPEEINFIEDVWLGHMAFGYSLEYHVRGLELGNAVFTEFAGTPHNFTKMRKKVIDMGAGHERFTWLVSGKPTAYDVAFERLIDKMKTKALIRTDQKLLLRYAKISGVLNLDEVENIEIVRKSVAQKLGVNLDELKQKIEPMQALYAIADHARTLLYAIVDGGLPSNIGGGYNLRVILRRALSFINRHNMPFDLVWVCERIAKDLKPVHPELYEKINHVKDVLLIEEKRYKSSFERATKLIKTLIVKGCTFKPKELLQLYDSHGITPELVQQIASEHSIEVKIPADFYAKVSERHMERVKEKKEKIDVKGFPKTQKLCYEDIYKFKARVVGLAQNKCVILDKTAFYPRGGGQEPDHGRINNSRVYDVEEYSGVVVHFVENPSFKLGDIVDCEINIERRKAITAHHDATHIINGAARTIIGPWIWQEGSKKDFDKAHLDVSHYKPLSHEQVKSIENLANRIVQEGLKIEKIEIARSEAEKKYGFRIYQGGAVPKEKLRIIKIGDFDIEACAGTHGSNTSEIRKIIITKVERPADGIVRFVFKASKAAEEYERKIENVIKESCEIMKVRENELYKAVSELLRAWKEKRKELEKARIKKAKQYAKKLKFDKVGKFKILIAQIQNVDLEGLKEISKILSSDDTIILLFGLKEKIWVFGSAGKNAIASGINIAEIVSKLCADLGGKGGGDMKVAQGFGKDTKKIKSCLESIRVVLYERAR